MSAVFPQLSDAFDRVRTSFERWVGFSRPPARDVIESANWDVDALHAFCSRCGESVGPGEATHDGCASCRGQSAIGSRVVRLGAYQPPLKNWITEGKYEQWWELLDELGARLGDRIDQVVELDAGKTIVVPVPMPWQRRLYRRLDHSRIIASAVAQALSLDLHMVLGKSHSVPQASLTATDRRRGRRGWMFARRRVGGWPLKGLHVILIDDVKTTGTTLRTASRILRQLGASKVTCGVLAVADHPSRRQVREPGVGDHEASSI